MFLPIISRLVFMLVLLLGLAGVGNPYVMLFLLFASLAGCLVTTDATTRRKE